MGLKLHVRLIEGRDLAPKDANGLSDPYVVFQFGKQKAKSSVVEKSLQPVWNEEFFFAIDDIHTEVLQIVVWDHDFLGTADFMGRISISAMDVYNAPDYTLGPSWFPLEKRHQKQNITGDILLAVMILGQPESPDGPFVSGTPFSEADNIMPPSSPLSTPTSTHMPSLSPPSIHHYPSPPFQPLGSPTELSDSANVGEREREREGERERERERHSPIGSPIAAALGSFSKSIASRASSHVRELIPVSRGTRLD